MTTADEPGVSIGDVSHSTFAIGSHAHAESHHGTSPARDQAAEELLAAVRELRADLARLQASEQTRSLDEALADTEDEITRTGAAGASRRQRLRDLLTDAQTVLTLFTSAGTVAGLLGM
jgi:DNA-binding CsgD family transcriptional regulator